MSAKASNIRTLQQPLQAAPTAPIEHPHSSKVKASSGVEHLQRVARLSAQTKRDAAECAKVASLPIKHEHAAGIDVGDSTHWVCVDATPDGSDTVRAFPAHTPGLRQLVDRLRQCGVTTVALEASGVYGHVLFLTLGGNGRKW